MSGSRLERRCHISRACAFQLKGRKRVPWRSVVTGGTRSVSRICWCSLVSGFLAVILQHASAWHIQESLRPRVHTHTHHITEAYGKEVGEIWLNGSLVDTSDEERPEGTPAHWKSSSCMSRWNMTDLQKEVDPMGYLVVSEGREQLGNNRILISDGLVIARALNRTLVEFPVKHSRIHTPDAHLGFCDYWDCDELCSYHRILDLQAFRHILRDGRIGTDGFLRLHWDPEEKSLMCSLATSKKIIDFFREYQRAQVIDLNRAWKSGLQRSPVHLIRPNPYYRKVVNNLLELQSWDGGRFIAVQWRTETSKGNLTDCLYRHVLPAVEKRRKELNYSVRQIFFNVDLVGQASTTYSGSAVRANAAVVNGITARYPLAFHNFVNKCLQGVSDAGSKAILSGLVSASSRLLLSSSFNGTGNAECQKPHSKYIDLVAEWRLDPAMFNKPASSIIQLFPGNFGDYIGRIETSRLYHDYLPVFVAMLAILGVLVLMLKRRAYVAVRESTSTSKVITPQKSAAADEVSEA